MAPPPSRGLYTQSEVDEIVANRLKEQSWYLWEHWVNARLAEFGELKERLERIEARQQREDAARRLFLRIWGAVMVVVIPVGTVVLQHYVGQHP